MEILRKVEVSENLPKKKGRYITNKGFQTLFKENIGFVRTTGLGGHFPLKVDWWLEEVNLDDIEDKRELTATVLVNAIRSLDEQGARHLVKELCERFYLFPTDEEVANQTLFTGIDATVFFKKGVDWVVNRLKGGY